MNFLQNYFHLFFVYVTNKLLVLITLIISLFIFFGYYFINAIDFWDVPENLNFIYWNFISPFIIYISMVFFASCLSILVLNKRERIRYLFFNSLYSLIFVIVIKLLWNLSKIILIDSSIFLIKFDSNLYPLFLLFFFWIMIYFFFSYYLPIVFLKQNKKISFYLFIDYIIEKFWIILSNIVFSLLFSFGILFIFAFLFSQIEKIVIFLFTEDHYFHMWVENYLYILFQVIFAHSLILTILYKSKFQIKLKKIKS